MGVVSKYMRGCILINESDIFICWGSILVYERWHLTPRSMNIKGEAIAKWK